MSQVNDYNMKNTQNSINPFDWPSLNKLSDPEFAKRFNNITELGVTIFSV